MVPGVVPGTLGPWIQDPGSRSQDPWVLVEKVGHTFLEISTFVLHAHTLVCACPRSILGSTCGMLTCPGYGGSEILGSAILREFL